MRVVTIEMGNAAQLAINLDQIIYARLNAGKDGNMVVHFNEEKHTLVLDAPQAEKVWAALKA
jgi:hypothetical protein